MQADQKTGLGLVVGLGVVLLVVFIFLTPGGGSPAGNARVLLWTRVLLSGLQREETNSAAFDYHQASEETRQKIQGICSRFHLLFKTNFSWTAETNRQIVVVCEDEFDNVSSSSLPGSDGKNSAHAAGYSDGAVGLISPAEFANLDLTGFVSAASLAANNETNSPTK
jgi:hypothetical protein